MLKIKEKSRFRPARELMESPLNARIMECGLAACLTTPLLPDFRSSRHPACLKTAMIATAQIRARVALRLPDGLWEHPLFQSGSVFSEPATPLPVDQCDARLRRLRNMPSTADESRARIVEGAARLYEWGAQVLRQGPASDERELLERVGRLARGMVTGISRPLADRMLNQLALQMPLPLLAFLPSAADPQPEKAAALKTIEVLLLDRLLSANPQWRRRYLKRIYRVVDAGLTYNSTTDVTRVIPPLRWIRELLEREHTAGCAYVDVGCAVAAGAPAVAAAAQILRPGGLCSEIHGVDVVPPSRELARRMLRACGAALYGADPVRRPLPREYDVALLANVHRHLNRELQEKLLSNLGLSLTPGGLLIVNWRFDQDSSPALCLRRVGARLVIVGERNCARWPAGGNP